MANLAPMVALIVGMVGFLTNSIASAVANFGVYTMANASTSGPIFAKGIFGVGTGDQAGLIYWMKEDLIFLVNNLGSNVMAPKLANFIAALIMGSGATGPSTWVW